MGAVIAGLLAWWASGLLARLLIGGGISLVVATGLNALIESFLSQAASYASGVPADVLGLSLLFGWGTALSIIGGALLTRVGIQTAANIIGYTVQTK